MQTACRNLISANEHHEVASRLIVDLVYPMHYSRHCHFSLLTTLDPGTLLRKVCRNNSVISSFQQIGHPECIFQSAGIGDMPHEHVVQFNSNLTLMCVSLAVTQLVSK